MAKKAITQVMEWLQETKGDAVSHQPVTTTAEQCAWAIRLLKRVDARDSQNQKPRKRKAKR
jgi:hypothetical protein